MLDKDSAIENENASADSDSIIKARDLDAFTLASCGTLLLTRYSLQFNKISIKCF